MCVCMGVFRYNTMIFLDVYKDNTSSYRWFLDNNSFCSFFYLRGAPTIKEHITHTWKSTESNKNDTIKYMYTTNTTRKYTKQNIKRHKNSLEKVNAISSTCYMYDYAWYRTKKTWFLSSVYLWLHGYCLQKELLLIKSNTF